MTSRKHSWSEPNRVDANSTLRTCNNCGLVRRTRHEPDNNPPHWTEFERGGVKVAVDKTPGCR